VQDRQDGAVAEGIEELVGVPRRGQRPCLGFPVANDAGDEQIGIVEDGTEGVGQRVTELAALVHRARRLGSVVAGNSTRKRELLEQAPHPRLVTGDLGIDLAIGPLEPRVGHHARPTVARAGDEHHVQIARHDRPIEVRVDEVESGCGPEVPEQARLDVPGAERLAQQRVVVEIDLPDGQIVRRPPPGVDPRELLGRQRSHIGSPPMLLLNAGSSSLKVSVFDVAAGDVPTLSVHGL
jgi:hypothetical protein